MLTDNLYFNCNARTAILFVSPVKHNEKHLQNIGATAGLLGSVCDLRELLPTGKHYWLRHEDTVLIHSFADLSASSSDVLQLFKELFLSRISVRVLNPPVVFSYDQDHLKTFILQLLAISGDPEFTPDVMNEFVLKNPLLGAVVSVCQMER